MDELYSYGLANSEYLPFMHFGESSYDVQDWMLEYEAGENLIDLVRNAFKDYRILKNAHFSIKNTEIYSAYLTARANSQDVYTTTWVSGQDYVDYITASDTNRFNYASVYYNQRGDVHPPLFYILLHTICSFFPGVFSKWFGIGINMAAILATVCMLYHIGKKHIGGELYALVLSAVYGLSVAGISTGIFIRMYALLTLMTVTSFGIHLSILRDREIKGHKGVLFAVTILGFLTHYYYVIFAIFTAIVIGIVFLIHKKWSELLKYIALLAAAACTGLIIWPFAISHVFSGYRGISSLNILMNCSFSKYNLDYVRGLIQNMCLNGAGWVMPMLVLICVGSVVSAVIVKKKRGLMPPGDTSDETFKKNVPEILALTVVPVGAYICLVAQIVPFLTERYFMCVFPFVLAIALMLGFVAGKVWDDIAIRKENKWKPSVVTLILTGAFLLAMNNAAVHTPTNLFTGGQETVKVPDNTDCVYVLPDGDWNESAEDTNILAQCRQVAIVYQSNLDILSGYEYREGTNVMVCIQKGLDEESVLDKVKDALSLETLSKQQLQDSNTFYRFILK